MKVEIENIISNILYVTLDVVRLTMNRSRMRLYRLFPWFRPARGTPFIVTKIKGGVVTARQMSEETGHVLKGGIVSTFPLEKASYLQTGDITVLHDDNKKSWADYLRGRIGLT